ncbi:MAG: SpoIIE family protein phosphatase [Ectothiorhodospira sp.]
MTSTTTGETIQAPSSPSVIDRQFAGDLLMAVEAVTPEHTNEQVAEIFSRHRWLQNLPVIHGQRPMGLINRSLFHNMMAKPFYPELYNRRSCIAFMDKNPLVAEVSTSIRELTAMAVRMGEKVFADGFILVEHGVYAGVGQTLDLMEAMTELQARQHHQLMESIHYASLIQTALLKPSRQAMKQHLPGHHWIIWRPRDLVGGDLFHFVPLEDGFLAALVDCTGHGVPGAFMTLIAQAALERALVEHGHDDPAALLAAMNQGIKHTLDQHHGSGNGAIPGFDSDDGLDGVLMRVSPRAGHWTFSGARLPLLRIPPASEGPAEYLRGDRHGVGYRDTPLDTRWRNHRQPCLPGERLYLASDGVIDQIGGEKRIAFGKKRLGQCLRETRHLDMEAQEQAFCETFSTYQGPEPTRDDITLIGLELPLLQGQQDRMT